jgi:hypothetical protein
MSLYDLSPEELATIMGQMNVMPSAAQGGISPSLGGMIPGSGIPDAAATSAPSELYPGQSQEIPKPDDYWSRLAQASGSQPFDFNIRRDPNPIEIILGLAAAVANAKTTRAARKLTDVETKNERVRQAASDLAKQRHELRKQRELRDSIAGLSAAGISAKDLTLGKTTVEADIGGQKVRVKPGDITGSVKFGDTVGTVEGGPTLAGRNKPPQPGRLGASDPGIAEDAKNWADALEAGEVQMQQLPFGAVRTAAMKIIKDRGGHILVPKARATIGELNAARVIVDELEKIISGIPSGTGLGRIGEGLRSKAAKAVQSPGRGEDTAIYDSRREGMLANLSRATGERGVLTDQDVSRARELTPTVFDTAEVRRRKLSGLRSHFASVEQRIIKTYSESMGGAAVGKAADPLGIR